MNTASTSPSRLDISPHAPSVMGHDGGSGSKGLLVGLIPLALLIITLAVMALLDWIALSLTAALAFAVRQWLMVAITAGGLLGSALVYAIACVFVLRRVGQRQRLGLSTEAATALWTMALSALVVLSPVLIALLVTQTGL